MNPVNYLVEFLGTFVFIYIILQSATDKSIQPFIIAFGLLAAITMFGNISGGHFNPAVTIMAWAKGDSDMEPVGYIIAQIAGGLLAWKAHELITATSKVKDSVKKME